VTTYTHTQTHTHTSTYIRISPIISQHGILLFNRRVYFKGPRLSTETMHHTVSPCMDGALGRRLPPRSVPLCPRCVHCCCVCANRVPGKWIRSTRA
jgi:hypothetical protein